MSTRVATGRPAVRQQSFRHRQFTGDATARQLAYDVMPANLDEVVRAYSKEQDPTRKQNLARAYGEITGKEIKNRSAILLD